MRPPTLLLALLLPAAAHACAAYRRCHCYDSSGAPNDAVTAKVCAGYQDQGAMVDASAASDNARECAYIGEVDVEDDVGYWNNCEWRVRCQEAGATGSDSSCRLKD
ncbi:hypothetical protein COCVIDRAFT_22214 [Neofusicoccum parvum]|uniref:Uncharacterized protein n=1 Tax=Neofusicoccum parvum TaxID=310453 RepID=A0ACB5RR52_9PEZI|nr:hypothetical protein COCVIDRAFT_22214 [Neofusicoccum parvum]GME50718.1 hypothetical protein COCVIDRAFT_22214 [Neofusicoccum parvum]